MEIISKKYFAFLWTKSKDDDDFGNKIPANIYDSQRKRSTLL